LPDLNPGTPVYAFSAKWNSAIYGPFSATDGGDGFSFNFGQLNNNNLLVGPVESGYGTGLSFCVQTHTNNAPGFYIRMNGQVIAQQSYMPLAQWGSFNGARHLFEVDWSYYTGMTVKLDGQPIFTNVITRGFVPRAGDRMVWGARSSSFTEDLRLDNIAVVTGGNLANAVPMSPYFQDPGAYTPGSAAFYNGPYRSNRNYPTGDYWAGATITPSNALSAYIVQSGIDNYGLPGYWSLEGSSDAGTTWNTVNSEQTRWNGYWEARTFLITSDDPTSYGAYQFHILGQDPFTSSNLSLGNLQYFTFAPVGPPPAISVALSGNAVQLTWPTNQPGLVVQQNINIASSNWGVVTNPVSIVNGKYQVIVPLSSTNTFFSLGVP
jgi:hypothetical protein